MTKVSKNDTIKENKSKSFKFFEIVFYIKNDVVYTQKSLSDRRVFTSVT